MLKPLFRYGLLFAATLLFIGCEDIELESHWREDTITIDGLYTDWDEKDLLLSSETNITMGVQNDSSHVYLMCYFADEIHARRVEQMGVTILLRNDRNDNTRNGIQYTASTELADELAFRSMNQHDIPSDIKQLVEQYQQNLPKAGELLVYENGQERVIFDDDPNGPNAGAALFEDMFCYEFKLPLPAKADSVEKLDIVVKLGGLEKNDLKKMMMEKMKGNAPLGMHKGPMPNPEQMTNRMETGNGKSMPIEMPTKQKFHVCVTLARD